MFDPCRIPGSRSLHERKTGDLGASDRRNLFVGGSRRDPPASASRHAAGRRFLARGSRPQPAVAGAPDHQADPAGREKPGCRRRAVRIVKRACRRKARDPYIARSRAGDSGDSGSSVLDAVRRRLRRAAERKQAFESIKTMFRWFEKRLDPFPAEEPVEPPKTLIAFCVHYTRGAWPYIIVDAVLVTAIAIAEVWMFGFLGRIVDWLSGAEPRDLPADRGLEARRHGLHRAVRAAGHRLVPFAASTSRR